MLFSLIAGGSKPLSYQWLKDGVAVEGETEPELQLENITISDQADYTVLVTNRGGTVESSRCSAGGGVAGADHTGGGGLRP